MRETSDNVAVIVGESHQIRSTVAVYYDGEPVFDELPITEGSLEVDSTNAVPGQLSATVPRHPRDEYGRTLDLTPDAPGPSINAEGTQLVLNYHVSIPGKPAESVALGWYRITEWDEDAGEISITAESLEALIAEARFLWAVTVTQGTPYPAAASRLLGNLLPLDVTADPTPTTGRQIFEDERLDALTQLVTSWPARMYVDDTGTLVIAPPWDDANDPVALALTDGERGTVVRRPTSGTRDGIYNAVKAAGESTGTTKPVATVAYLRDGPRRWNGPYGNVPYFYSSPLLTTKNQATRAANTRLANLQVTAEPVTADIAPDPRLEVGDIVTLAYRGDRLVVRITGISLPLTHDGVMTIRGHIIERAADAA